MQGIILSEHGLMIQGLLDETALNLYTSCVPDGELSARKSSRSPGQFFCALDITVYGPMELFEQIGIYFQEYGTYLQDPQTCHMDVRYCNPHRLSSDDFNSCPMLSEFISQTNTSSYLHDITQGPDLLDILSSNADLEETPQPRAIRATLQR